MTAPKPSKIRKASWLYEDLAHQTILPHHLAAMLILRYLAKGANDTGRHYVSRATVCADNGGLSTNTFNRALKYLNSFGILTWKKGFGNQYGEANEASTYQLHLKAMQRLVTEQGVFMAGTREYKPNLRLLHGDALTARVKALPAINEQFATSDGESATSDDGFATSDNGFARSDNRSLTLYDLPSTGLPSVEDPLQELPMLNPPTLDSARGGAPTVGGNPQCVPLRAIIAPSRPLPPLPQPKEETITFDDEGMWTSNEAQKFPTNLLVRYEPSILPRDYHPEREVRYLEDDC